MQSDELAVGTVVDSRYKIVLHLGEANGLDVYVVEHTVIDRGSMTALVSKSAGGSDAALALTRAALHESDRRDLNVEDTVGLPDRRTCVVLKPTSDQLRDILAGTRVFGG